MVKENKEKMAQKDEEVVGTEKPVVAPEKSQMDKLIDMTNLLKRNQADFENYRKQQDVRSEVLVKMAAKDVILQVLPIIDNFELALKNCDMDKNQKDFCQGVELIYAQLKSLLDANKVMPIEVQGEFDPYFHEALMKVESEKPENTIIEEFQKGYILHGQVIRHAKVKISAGKVNATKVNPSVGKVDEENSNEKLETINS